MISLPTIIGGELKVAEELYKIGKANDISLGFLIPVLEGTLQIVNSATGAGGRVELNISGITKTGQRYFKVKMESETADGSII